jgi:hypothetical protein
MRYLKGTLEFGLYYNGDQYFKLIGYIDSDWDGSVSEKKEYFRMLFQSGVSHDFMEK